MEARIGTHFIPGLETPEGWFIHDSTPIGLMLNAKYPDRPIMPSAPVQRIAAHLLEDWADEWFGRYAISSRWCYPHNIDHVAIGFYANSIGKFMAEGLTESEHAEAAQRIKFVRDNFGLTPARIGAAAQIRLPMCDATSNSLCSMRINTTGSTCSC
jgi:glutathione S-transferase